MLSLNMKELSNYQIDLKQLLKNVKLFNDNILLKFTINQQHPML